MTEELGTGFDKLRALQFGQLQAEARWRHGRDDYAPLIQALDAQIAELTQSILHKIEYGAKLLQQQSEGKAFPGWDGERLFKMVHTTFLTTLPVDDVDQVSFHFGPDLGRTVAVLQMPSGFAVIRVDEIEFGYGSVWSKIWTKIEGPAAAIALTCLVAAQPLANFQADMQINAQISRIIAGDICELNTSFEPSIWSIRDLVAAEINPNNLDARDPNSVARICALQVMLRLAGKYMGPIDGIPGSRTMAAIRSLEEEHHFDPGSDEVYEWLVDHAHQRG